MSTATQYKLYVPPVPSMIVQYPPQHPYGESAATTTLPPISVAYGPYQQQPAQTQQHTTYTASQLATPVKTQQHSTVLAALQINLPALPVSHSTVSFSLACAPLCGLLAIAMQFAATGTDRRFIPDSQSDILCESIADKPVRVQPGTEAAHNSISGTK
ncbi:hypothetical protein GGX14DRAFT_399058 [Mycena pura]|uniref:Uncharacterized protein n=1 Tax=Mycena pura TaxID=153505 RepID=A0AAD6V5J8_9AGAR|nr:hypothetical protein GGX14DRAFT_399058 [Mycena pura]